MSSPDNIDWFLMGPVIEGYISYSDLKNGTLNLYDLFVLNEIMNKKNEVIEESKRKIQRENALKKVK